MVTKLGLFGCPAANIGQGNFMSAMNFVLQLAGPRDLSFRPEFPSQECHVNDQGVRTIIQLVDFEGTPINLRSNLNSLIIKCLRPDGTSFDIAGSLLTNGLDGKCYFTSSDVKPPFDQYGIWFIQARVNIDGVIQSSRWGCFSVQPNIDAA